MLDEAQELLRYASSMLGYPYPDDLPEIRLEPDLECLGQFKRSWLTSPVITIRHWRPDNAFDRSVLVHEICHHLQALNDMELSEVEAVTTQCRFLQSQGIDPRTELSFEQVLDMTDDPQFAKLEWL